MTFKKRKIYLFTLLFIIFSHLSTYIFSGRNFYIFIGFLSVKEALRQKAKGQLISKCFLGPSISSNKQTDEFVFTSMRIVLVRFLEEIDDPKKPFRNQLTFSKLEEIFTYCPKSQDWRSLCPVFCEFGLCIERSRELQWKNRNMVVDCTLPNTLYAIDKGKESAGIRNYVYLKPILFVSLKS